MMNFIKKLVPESALKRARPWYHGFLARLSAAYFGWPSERLIVIGITGTAGKSTTAAMLSHILNFAGIRAGYVSTVNFFDGRTNHVNKHGLSMPNEVSLQRSLDGMVKNNCRAAIIECTSEGLEQNRHWGINFDAAVFTNLSRAHLESHGSFGNYKEAKAKLFAFLGKSRKKSFFPEKIIGANLDDQMAGYFLSFRADKKFGVTFNSVQARLASSVFNAAFTNPRPDASEFTVSGVPFVLNLLGSFNAQNAAMAASCAAMLGVDLTKSAEALLGFKTMPGRMEEVANQKGFHIIVDYGCEPVSFKAALESVSLISHSRLIHVFGSTGGHRDVAKRFIFGQTSAEFADYIIVTNDDVYNSDPAEIAKNIAEGIGQAPRQGRQAVSVETILDRRAAIARALRLAQKDDVVLITGKGSEQFLVLPGNKRIEWDEVSVVKEELQKLELGSRN
jgi:UDP-N-acetylmuramoyl-L-alanyl-D-glutamate--2,6-diaminopimelate ligase